MIHLNVAADRIGKNFRDDPELSLPEKPFLPPELQLFPFGRSGIIVDGANGLQTLGGKSARTTLPKVLKEFNGHQTVAELESKFKNLPAGTVRNIVALLFSRGMLEDGASAPAPQGHEDLYSFLGRFADVTRVHRNRGEAFENLQGLKIVLAAGEHTALMSEQLKACGVGEVTPWDQRDPATLAEQDYLIALATRAHEDLQPFLDAAWKAGVKAIHARIAATEVEVGPLFVPGLSACFEAFRYIHPRPEGDAGADMELFWLGMVANQLFHSLSFIVDAFLFNSMHHYTQTPHGITHESRGFTRLPGIGHGAIDAPRLVPGSAELQTWQMNTSLYMPPRSLLNPRVYQNHYSQMNIALAKERGFPFYGGRKIALPDPVDLQTPLPWISTPSPTALNLETLSTVLHYAAGYKISDEQNRWRIAPTGGALESPELFLIIDNVDGLPAGVYHYCGYDHALEELKHSPENVYRAALNVAPHQRRAATIVGTAYFGKVRSKYFNFGYKIVNLDGGVANWYIHQVSRALGLDMEEYPDFNDAGLTEAVCLPTAHNRYVLTFAMGLGAPLNPPRPVSINYESTNLDRVISASFRVANPIRRLTPPLSRPAELPRDAGSLGEVLLRRRSRRVFEDQPLPEPTLRHIVSVAWNGVADRIRQGGIDLGMKPLLLVRHGDADLGAGVYWTDPETSAWICIRESLSQEDLLQVATQRQLASAPAVLMIMGSFEKALYHRGPRGYRELLSYAGTMGAGCQLSATSLGLSSCLWGGMMEAGFRQLTGLDGYTQTPLFGVSLGFPIKEPA